MSQRKCAILVGLVNRKARSQYWWSTWNDPPLALIRILQVIVVVDNQSCEATIIDKAVPGDFREKKLGKILKCQESADW